MKSPIRNGGARRRSSSFEDLAHLVAAALRLEDEVDHAEDESTCRNENRLETNNTPKGQDQPSPSTITTNAVPPVADLLASHGGNKEDLPTTMPFPSRRRRRSSATIARRRGSSATRRRCSQISNTGSICASLEDEIAETLTDKALMPISDSPKESTSHKCADPHFFPSGSNATKKAQAILYKKQDANVKEEYCGESFRLASFDPSRFVKRGGLVVLKEESHRSFSNASA